MLKDKNTFFNLIKRILFLNLFLNVFQFKAQLFNLTDKVYDGKLEVCGMKGPQTQKDCTSFDNNTNSCCFYSYGSNTIGCYMLNTRFSGSINYGGMTITCESTFTKIKNYFFLFLFMLYSLLLLL